MAIDPEAWARRKSTQHERDAWMDCWKVADNNALLARPNYPSHKKREAFNEGGDRWHSEKRKEKLQDERDQALWRAMVGDNTPMPKSNG